MNKKILIVEDEPAYLKVLYDQLIERGYGVIYAPDGEKGLKLALTQKPDLILLDLILPKFNGLQMLKALRADEWGKKVPIFILTNVNEAAAISGGMNDKTSFYIVKSDIKLPKLLWMIELYLSKKPLK